MSGTFSGYLLIADITGYTLYLTQSELEHAREILAELLEVLVEHTRPPLVLSRLAGDAVISYALAEGFIQGQTFIEMIEGTYVAFRLALERMVLNNTCQCNACRNIASLDLKFFTHSGTFAVQRIQEHNELVGSDVNLLHRLLKNHVVEATGLRAYALYTRAAVEKLGIQEISQSMKSHSESYEHLGEVQVWVQDMLPALEGRNKEHSLRLSPEKVFMQWQIDIDLPPEKVWDYLAQPEFRKTLIGTQRMEVVNKYGGRISTGSVYHCFHGKQVVPQMVMEWRPFERMVTRDRLPVPLMEVHMVTEYRLEAIPTGTRFSYLLGRAEGPLPGRLLAERSIRGMDEQGGEDLLRFKRLLEADTKYMGSAAGAQLLVSPEMFSRAAQDSLSEGQT